MSKPNLCRCGKPRAEGKIFCDTCLESYGKLWSAARQLFLAKSRDEQLAMIVLQLRARSSLSPREWYR